MITGRVLASFFVVAIGVCVAPALVSAQTPTPTATVTVSPTATPSACEAAQLCVYDAVPTAVASCVASNPSCTESNPDKYAVTAQQIADRAISVAQCGKKKTKFSCNACYARAKLPLRDRFYGKLFRGLLGQAVKLIEAERKSVCPSLKKS